jgi:hypothetical protein
MVNFITWLHEYAGQTVGQPVNGPQYLKSGIKSATSAEGQGRRSMSPNKADCNFLGKNCPKNPK